MATSKLTDEQLGDWLAEHEDEIVDYALGRIGKERIDWDDLLFRIEKTFDIDLPESTLDPRIVWLKNKIRRARREANS